MFSVRQTLKSAMLGRVSNTFMLLLLIFVQSEISLLLQMLVHLGSNSMEVQTLEVIETIMKDLYLRLLAMGSTMITLEQSSTII
jgi:hypothetical protein